MTTDVSDRGPSSAPHDLESEVGVVIVGAGLSGLRVAEGLRRAGYDGRLVLVGDEPHLPYDRPPLSKEFMRAEKDDTTLKPSAFFHEQGIEVILGTSASLLDTRRRRLELADGRVLPYGELVIATGLSPRRLEMGAGMAGVHVLRSIDDARALRDEATSGRRAVVVGAGFLGCELAASLIELGLGVVLVDVQPAPLAAVLGVDVGRLVQRLHDSAGVDFRSGTGLAAVEGDESVTAVVLSNGDRVEADLVVLAIGSVPATEWLHGSDVPLAAGALGGVLADETGRTEVEHVWATGDVAAWRQVSGEHKRVEHWSNASEQAKALVPALLGQGGTPTSAPHFFWSDQFGVKIQAVGRPGLNDTVHVVEDDGRNFVAYYESEGVLTAVVGAGRPRQVMGMRPHVASGARLDDVLARP